MISSFLRLHNSGVKRFEGAFGACKSLITPVPWLPGGAFEAAGEGGVPSLSPSAAPLPQILYHVGFSTPEGAVEANWRGYTPSLPPFPLLGCAFDSLGGTMALEGGIMTGGDNINTSTMHAFGGRHDESRRQKNASTKRHDDS